MRNPLPPGSRIHEYKIVRVLGTGGFGITCLAFDRMLDGWVALKEYFPVAVAVRTDDVRVVASTEGRDVFSWDIYALAAVSYRVLTGEPPPNAPDRMPDDCYEPLAERVGGVSTGWLAAIDHGLALQPDDRPQTVTAWRMTLHDSNRMDAAEMEKLLEAASKGDADALARLRAEADAGHSEAQFALGEAYFALGETYEYDYVNANGELAPADYAAAVAWYHRAADQGHAVAQFRLGRMYHEGVRNDHAATVAWYRKAAEHGLAGAQYQLGRMYEYGEGVPPDDEAVHAELAVTWYGRAADQGYAEAQYSLGRMYQSGCGDSVLQDVKESVAWFRKAASRGHVEAQFELGHMHSQGTGVPEDNEEAVVWYRKAASQGHPGAQYYLGEVYHRGSGVPKDAAEAIACYRKAAHGNDEGYSTKAQLAPGGMYRTALVSQETRDGHP